MKFIYVLIAIFISASVYGDEKLCMYPDTDTRELEQAKNFGSIEDGLLTVDSVLMKKMMWSKFGMQCLYMNYPEDKGWFYINQNGLGRGSPFTHDNDCNSFQSGLAVGLSKVVSYSSTKLWILLSPPIILGQVISTTDIPRFVLGT